MLYVDPDQAEARRTVEFFRSREQPPPPPRIYTCDDECDEYCEGGFGLIYSSPVRKPEGYIEPLRERVYLSIARHELPILQKHLDSKDEEHEDDESEYYDQELDELIFLFSKAVHDHMMLLSKVNTELKETHAKHRHRQYFKTQIIEELIAEAMNPCRIQAQMNQFDDVEAFFDMMV